MQSLGNLVVWVGPVSASNLAGAALPVPARVVTINAGLGGIGSTHFANLGRRHDGDLEELLAERGVGLDSYQTVTLAAFSAGHGLVEQLLRNQATADRIDALVAADAYYTSKGAGPKPGYRSFCERAADGERLAVISTSSIGGPGYDSAQTAVGTLLEGIELSGADVPLQPEPASVLARGGLVWLSYGSKYGLGAKAHVMHATDVAPAVLSGIVTPWLQSRAQPKSSAGSGALALGAAAAVIAASELL